MQQLVFAMAQRNSFILVVLNILLYLIFGCEGRETEYDLNYDYMSGKCGVATDKEDVYNHQYDPKYIIEITDHENIPENLMTRHRSAFRPTFEDPRKIWAREAAVSPASFPWIAQIRKYILGAEGETEFVCSAAIISSHALLTSAICVTNLMPSQIVVKVGDYVEDGKDEYEKVYAVSEISASHDEFLALPQDIAVIKILSEVNGEGVTFSEGVLPVCLPTADTPFLDGADCSVAGYEHLSVENKILSIQDVPLISKENCSFNGEFFTEGMLCAGSIPLHKNRCPVNAGSPLVCKINGRSTLIGIQNLYGCGWNSGPSTYASIQYHLQWIARRLR